jgi:hypothetical protein
LVSHGIRHQPRAIAASACAAIVAISALSLNRQLFDTRYQREDVRAAAQFLTGHAADGDRIVVSAAEQKLTLGYYLGRDRKIEKLPVRIVRSTNEAEKALGQWAGQRTWVVLTREWGEDPKHHLSDTILARRPDALRAEFPGVRVFEIEP